MASRLGAPLVLVLALLTGTQFLDAAVRDSPAAESEPISDLLARFDAGDEKVAALLVGRGAEAVAPLLDRLAGPDSKLAARAADALSSIGEPAVKLVAERAAAGEIRVRVLALGVLGRLAAQSDAALTPLSAALADREPPIRAAAAAGIGAAGPRVKERAAALSPLLQDADPRVRIAAAGAMLRARAAGRPSPAWSALERLLSSEEAALRSLACVALADTGFGADTLIPPIVTATEDPDGGVRLTALRSLAGLGSKDPRVLSTLGRAITSGPPAERDVAYAAVAALTQQPVAEALRLGGPFRGRRPVGRRRGSNSAVDTAVARALDWLAAHQSKDGRWSSAKFSAHCAGAACSGAGDPSFDRGVTGLALLAFLGAGETPTSGKHAQVVKNGVAYLIRAMGADGSLRGPPAPYSHTVETWTPTMRGGVTRDERSTPEIAGDGSVYNHAIASLALCEAAMLTADPEVMAAARSATRHSLASWNPASGWRYRPRAGDADTSVTFWMSWGVAVAEAAGFADRLGDPEDGGAAARIAGAVAWIEKMTEPEFGKTGYDRRAGPPSRLQSEVSKFPPNLSESSTAAGVFIRALSGRTVKADSTMWMGTALIHKKLPRWSEDTSEHDFVYWALGSMAMQHAEDEYSKPWNEHLRRALIPNQQAAPDTHLRGSWDPVDAWSSVGGRVYATAMCCIALEAPWRIDRIAGWK